MVRRLSVLAFLAAACAVAGAGACGSGGSSSPGGGDDSSDPGPGGGDARAEVAEGDLVVEIVADRLTGNAPLTVHFTGSLTGCAEDDADYLWTFGAGTFLSRKDPGDFVFQAAGGHNVKFEAHCRSTGAIASDQVQVVVLGTADLSLSPVHLTSPTTVAPGDTLLFSFDVVNRGDRIDAPFDVLILLSKDELYQPDTDIVLKEIGIEGMKDGRFTPARIEFRDEPAPLPPDTAEGSYFLFVAVDPDRAVSEADRSDNVAQATSFVTVKNEAKDKAELQVSAPVFAQGTRVAAGKAFSFEMTIDNVGKKPAKNFKYAVFASADATPSPDDVRLTPADGGTVFNLDAGMPLALAAMLTVPAGLAPGHYTAIARVDIDNVVAEDDETNNVAVSPWTFEAIEDVVTGFDVAVESVEVAPHDTYWGGSVKATVAVRNAGTKPTPKFPLVFFVSTEPSVNTKYDPRLATTLADALAAGESRVVSAIVPIPSGPSLKPGDYYMSAVADPDSTLDELSKSNNWKYDPKPIHVFQEAFVDVGLGDAIAHPAVVEAGKEIKVAYTIANTGSTSSGAFVNWVVLSPDKTVSLADVTAKKDFVVGRVMVDAVDASSTVERIDKVPVPLALPHDVGTYYVGVIGDALNNLAVDKNKANHVTVTAEPLTVLGPKGGCYEDEYEPNGGPGDAAPLPEGETTGLGLCAGEDWYSVHMEPGQSLVVRLIASSPLYLEPRPVELDLELSDPEGRVLDASAAIGPEDRAAALAVPAAGEYLVRVFPRSPGNQAHYTLDVEVLDVLEGVDLTPTHVYAIPDAIFPGGLVSLAATVVNLGADPAAASRARVFLSAVGEWSAADPAIADVDVPEVPGSTAIEVKTPIQLPKETAGGTYHLILVLDADGVLDEVDEDNNLAATGPIEVDESMVCEDDEFDPNEAPEVATLLDAGGGAYQGLAVCPDLPDVYAIDLPVGVSFAASVSYDRKASKGWVAVDVIDPTGTAVLDSAPTSDAPIAGLPCVFTAGRYYVRVRVNPISGKAGPYEYSMALTVGSPLPGDVCGGDRAEPNNDFAGAAPIGCGVNNLTLCKKDKDFFKVPVTKGTALSLALDHGKSELKMGIYLDPKGSAVKTVSGNAALDWVAPQDATAYVVIEPKGTSLTEFKYRLSVDGVPGTDVAATGLTLTPEEVWQGEDVRLSFSLANACQEPMPAFGYAAFLSTNPALDGADVPILYGTVTGGVEGKAGLPQVVKAMIPLDTAPGKYHVLVQADPADEVSESQEDNNVAAAALSVGEVCVNDPLEPDDEPAMAAVIGAGTYQGLAICPYDNDWYRLLAAEGDAIVLTVHAALDKGDLDLRLYGPGDAARPVATSATQADVESLSYAVPAGAGGEYLIRVNGFLGAWNTYSLAVSIE